MSDLTNLVRMLKFYGACETSWVEQQLAANPDIKVSELWMKMLKLPDRVGIAWGAWMAKHINMECNNGTYSGMSKVNSGPSVEQLDVQEVERRILLQLQDYDYYIMRYNALIGGMRS